MSNSQLSEDQYLECDPTELPIHFQANFSCFIGNHAIVLGEELSVLEDCDGLYWLYSADDDEPLARLNITDVIKLAGVDIFALRRNMKALAPKE